MSPSVGLIPAIASNASGSVHGHQCAGSTCAFTHSQNVPVKASRDTLPSIVFIAWMTIGFWSQFPQLMGGAAADPRGHSTQFTGLRRGRQRNWGMSYRESRRLQRRFLPRRAGSEPVQTAARNVGRTWSPNAMSMRATQRTPRPTPRYIPILLRRLALVHLFR